MVQNVLMECTGRVIRPYPYIVIVLYLIMHALQKFSYSFFIIQGSHTFKKNIFHTFSIPFQY